MSHVCFCVAFALLSMKSSWLHGKKRHIIHSVDRLSLFEIGMSKGPRWITKKPSIPIICSIVSLLVLAWLGMHARIAAKIIVCVFFSLRIIDSIWSSFYFAQPWIGSMNLDCSLIHIDRAPIFVYWLRFNSHSNSMGPVCCAREFFFWVVSACACLMFVWGT